MAATSPCVFTARRSVTSPRMSVNRAFGKTFFSVCSLAQVIDDS